MTKEMITEKGSKDLIESWLKEAEAQDMTLEKLPEFLKKLLEEYGHDYGTIVHAMAAGMTATMWAMNRHPSGGITGFQAGAVTWRVIEALQTFDEGPKKMLCFHKMLFPQYKDKFQKTIPPEVWEYLQENAREKLDKGEGAHAVRAHWRSIVGGVVPFGYKVEET